MNIGGVNLCNNIFLAPMAGVTDLAFRLMCKRFGAGLVYSEMVSAKALHYNDKKTNQLLVTDCREVPLCVQIFGSDPQIMAEGAKKALCTGAKILDINMGCPAPKIANNGDGSALLKNPQLIGRIVSAVVSAVDVPVTCKIRSGFDEVCNVEEIAHIIEQSGASAIAVHPRTRSMYYSGHSDWNIIRRVKNAVNIPVIGNGDIHSGADAKRMIETTGCDAVMIGRAARGNPFIFRSISEYLCGKEVSDVSVYERMKTLTEQIAMLVEQKGEYIGVRESRKHVAWYIKNMRDSACVRNYVCRIETYEHLIETLNEYTEFLKNEDIE